MPAHPQTREMPNTLDGKDQSRKPWRNHVFPAQQTAPRRAAAARIFRRPETSVFPSMLPSWRRR